MRVKAFAAAALVLAAAAVLAVRAQAPAPQAPPDPHAHHGATSSPSADGWVRYRHAGVGYSLEHPAGWAVNNAKGAVGVHLAHPTRPVHLYASAFTMHDGTLEEFAEAKFGVQPDVFKPLGPPRPLQGEGWSGLVQEAETIQDAGQTRRRILCAKHDSLYVSLALYADAKVLAEPDVDYERLFTSLRFETPAAAPTPSATHPH
jgi:hypothetical protein